MKYGLIGEKLGHSFSPEIHAALASYPYELCEVRREELEDFFRRRDFCGINVTIPYKETVIPLLDGVDPAAAEIGAVNTVVNRGGRLYGYNTDLAGMTALFTRAGISISGKKALILGTGGTSRTAAAAARLAGAREILKVSRSGREGALTYEDAVSLHADAQVLINTTPCGMFPDTDGKPIGLSAFPRLEGVIDVIYNPLRTRFVLEAKERGIPAAGGLYMLVMQAR
ncbi:MAG: shikimate dehydrogenase, partial [Clostridia bacterium]|nr:shikimate dehydrogenase [Clostridia bacterium]